jgi:hypothetical protein
VEEMLTDSEMRLRLAVATQLMEDARLAPAATETREHFIQRPPRRRVAAPAPKEPKLLRPEWVRVEVLEVLLQASEF